MATKTLAVCIAALALVAFVAANRESGRQNNKPGTCPVRGVGVCSRQCEHDGNCHGVQKCCETACGGKYCHTPGQPAPTAAPEAQRGGGSRHGYCVPQINQLVCETKCNRDNDCSQSRYKCCPTTCGGKVCSEPMSSPPPTPPPTRPPSNNPKPGTCKADLAQFSCTSECQSDSDCRYDLKCCRTTCGGRMCSAPLHTHPTTTSTTRRPSGSRPGECPATSPRANPAPGCPETCRRDTDCRRDTFKCCQNTCGGRDCVAPSINQG